MTIQAQRRLMISCSRELAMRSLSWGASGNMSMRCGARAMLIKASGAHFARMTARDVVYYSFERGSAQQAKKPSVECFLHEGIYRERPDVEVIVHVHPVFSVLIASATNVAVRMNIIPEATHYLGKVVDVPYFPAGSKKLAAVVRTAAQRASFIVMRNHGVIALRKTFEETLAALEAFEFICRLNVLARAADLNIPELV